MQRILRYAMPAVAAAGFLFAAQAASAGSSSAVGAQAVDPTEIQIAGAADAQSANLPVGTIRLRVIPKVGAKAMRKKINWKVMTYGRDVTGRRQQVAEVHEATPELVLPAGWYVVHAQLADQTIRHPVEVTAGKTFKYTLVKR